MEHEDWLAPGQAPKLGARSHQQHHFLHAGFGDEGSPSPSQSRQQYSSFSQNNLFSDSNQQQQLPPTSLAPPFSSPSHSSTLSPPTDRYQITSRLESGVYESFINDYINLYGTEKPTLEPVGDEDNISTPYTHGRHVNSYYDVQNVYTDDAQQHQVQSAHSQAHIHNHNMSTDPANNLNSPWQPHDYHDPYREPSSPDIHPGLDFQHSSQCPNHPRNHLDSDSSNRVENVDVTSRRQHALQTDQNRGGNNSNRSQPFSQNKSHFREYGAASFATSAATATATIAAQHTPPPVLSGYRDADQFRERDRARQSQMFNNSATVMNLPHTSTIRPGGFGSRRSNERDQGQNMDATDPFRTPELRSSYGSAENIALPPVAIANAQLPLSSSVPASGYFSGSSQPSASDPPYRNPYDAHSISRPNLDGLGYVDINAIADDGDLGLSYAQTRAKRGSILNVHRRSAVHPSASVAGPLSDSDGNVTGERSRAAFASDPSATEKAFGSRQVVTPVANGSKPRNRKKWLFIVLGLLILCGIISGVVVGLKKSKANNQGSNGSASVSPDHNGDNDNTPADLTGPDFDLNSAPVKKLLNNKNLHKVFMGMAYTPAHSQYPDCLTSKPLQNNVTLDMAVMGQLTNVIRLYGTDCQQTEMTLKAIDKLNLHDMKVWVGVWLDTNVITNTRQIEQLYSILDGPYTKYIKGVIVGNEVLFRQDLTLTQLDQYVAEVKSNLTVRNINLPVASADLGDNWTTDFTQQVDVVMSNVHPFFGGVTVSEAASWTWTFWQTHDVILTSGTNKGNVISEVGWPSQGGNDCAPQKKCPDATSGAVSGIPQMNEFMTTWVCQALRNQTEYFWFEAFDEPWKLRYNTPGQEWEDHWGLFDVNRNLKNGVSIPDCGGQTVRAS